MILYLRVELGDEDGIPCWGHPKKPFHIAMLALCLFARQYAPVSLCHNVCVCEVC